MNPDEDGCVLVTGDLVFASVVELLAKGEQFFAGRKELVFDLREVDHADSSGLALLLELLDRGNAQGVSIRFRNIPTSLLGIARLSNAEQLLSVTGS